MTPSKAQECPVENRTLYTHPSVDANLSDSDAYVAPDEEEIEELLCRELFGVLLGDQHNKPDKKPAVVVCTEAGMYVKLAL